MHFNLSSFVQLLHGLLALGGTYAAYHIGNAAKSARAHLDAKTAAIKNPALRTVAEVGEAALIDAAEGAAPALEAAAEKKAPGAGVLVGAAVAGAS